MNFKTRASGTQIALSVLLIVAIIVADQLTKWLVTEVLLRPETGMSFGAWLTATATAPLRDYDVIEVFTGLNLVMVKNTGISFGMFSSGSNLMPYVLSAMALLVSGTLLVWLVFTRRTLLLAALSFIIGGAVGNVIDRLRFGAVIDFVDVYVQDWHWPAFNLADSSIFIGTFLLLIEVCLKGDGENMRGDVHFPEI
ncbi:MAG: signal peptidase II [Alphaproteobacteria bacterium]|nr:signal peptidase II [Alphaproteobacteria bacterium]